MNLNYIVKSLDEEFSIHQYGQDPAFSRFIPSVYKEADLSWQSYFEPEFNQLFNGLMIKGAPDVQTVFLAVFPTEDVLIRFLKEGEEGDLLFMHHPLLMECGDPLGASGRGFVPIDESFIKEIKAQNKSVYTCHTPMDFHPVLNTSKGITEELNGEIIDGFETDYAGNNLIHLVDIESISTIELIQKLKELFGIKYVDFEGIDVDAITKIAVVAGCGDKSAWMEEAERRGAQAYVSGEIHCHIDNEYGQQKYQQIMDFSADTGMSLIGVSHSASEYLVHKTRMKQWFEEAGLRTQLLPQHKWWL